MQVRQPLQLTKKTIFAGSWLLSYNALARLMGVVKTVVLARILTPKDFGIFGIVGLSLAFLETFSETSVFEALVQKKEVTEADLSTAWLISVLRGVTIGALLFFSAPLVAIFFKQPGVTPYLQVMALAPLIRNFRNSRTIFFLKELRLEKEFVLRMTASLAELMVAVGAAVGGLGVWSFVLAGIGGAAVEAVLSFMLTRGVRLMRPVGQSVRELMRFSRWLWGSSILTYIANQGDDIVVGRVLGAAPLGFYQNAYKIASLPATQITSVVSQVGFPALATIIEDKPRLRPAFFKTVGVTAGLTLPASLVIFGFAEPLTRLVLGEAWLPLVPPLKILSIYGAIRSVATAVGPLFKAVGKPNYITTYGVLFTGVMFSLIMPLTRRWGIEGTAGSVLLASLLTQPFLWFKTYHLLKR